MEKIQQSLKQLRQPDPASHKGQNGKLKHISAFDLEHTEPKNSPEPLMKNF